MRRIAWTLAGMVLLAAVLPIFPKDAPTDPRLKGAFRKSPQNGWTFVHLEGTPSQIGFQQGYLLAPEIQDTEKVIALEQTHDNNKDWKFFRDAAKVPGRKVVIVFSNGPDNASMVAPDDVRAVAEDEGIPIYVISTAEVNRDPISTAVFRRIAQRTGGKAYHAKTWQKQVEAFEDIREDLGNSYTVTYYPQPNPNEGFRRITVEIISDPGHKYRVHSRPGYRPSRGV